MYYSPLRYPGGKNCIFPFISRLFYENNLLGIKYAEPYAGGAGLALRLLFEGYVNQIYINDLDPAIYSFWSTLKYRNSEFCEWVKNVDVSVENWIFYKEIQLNIEKYETFDIAKSTFFLNRTNVSGILKGGMIGGKEQFGKYKLDARFNKQDLICRIKKIGEIQERIFISKDDGIHFIRKIDRRKGQFFLYLDPPYHAKGSDLYMNFYREKDHKELARKVRGLKSNWIVSYDNSEFISGLYGDRKISYKLSQSASNKVGSEILIFSKNLDYSSSINSLKSPKTIS
jgi:DNA adenine methylase